MPRPRIVIVGAGLAGLAAARMLRERGAEALVVERRCDPGGRARDEPREGFVLAPGLHGVGALDRALLALIERVGLGPELLPIRPLAQALVHGGRIRPAEAEGPCSVARLPGVLPHQALRLRRLPRLLRRFRRRLDLAHTERAEPLDDRSAADFTRLYFGESVLRGWVAPCLRAELLAEPEQLSRVALLHHWLARGVGVTGSLRGPLARLADVLTDLRGDRLRTEVTAIEARGSAFAVSLATVSGRETVEADAVILATAATVAGRIAASVLTTPERAFLAGVRYAPSLVLGVALERPPLRYAARLRFGLSEPGPLWSAVVEPGGPHARAPEGAATATLVAGPSWSRRSLEAPGEEIEKAVLGDLERLLPGVAAAVRFTRLWRHREALPCFDVGRFRALARFRNVQRDLRARGRRIYFAGDALARPGLEGAVTSGMRAASEAASDFGLGRAGKAVSDGELFA